MTNFSCPMHPEITSEKPGKCVKCGMRLESIEKSTQKHPTSQTSSYSRLYILISLISLVTLVLTSRDVLVNTFLWQKSVSYFMIGFFLTFSTFKLLDLNGFAQGYASYDLIAKKLPLYAYIYPFIELFFALAMIFSYSSKIITGTEFIIMLISGLGVFTKIRRKEQFQCVCLGTFLNIPLTHITLIEDFGMAFLAGVMFFFSA